MKRFVFKENKIAKMATSTLVSTTTADDTAAFLDAKGYANVAVLAYCVSTSSDPTVTLKLRAHTASTGTAGTAVATVSWTGGTTGDLAALQSEVDIKGNSYRYFNVQITTASGKAKFRNVYLLGAPRHGPVSHMATVKSTAVASHG